MGVDITTTLPGRTVQRDQVADDTFGTVLLDPIAFTEIKIDSADDVAHDARPGEPFIIACEFRAGANSAAMPLFTAPFRIRFLDVWNVPRTSVASSTVLIKVDGTALTNAMVCAVVNVPTRTALLVDAARDAIDGEAVTCVTAGGSTQPACTLYFLVMRTREAVAAS